MMRTRILSTFVVLMTALFLAAFIGCSDGSDDVPADGDTDVVEADSSEDGDIVDEDAEPEAVEEQEEETDVVEEEEVQVDGDVEEADPCEPVNGSNKCRNCGKSCVNAEDCAPGYTCMFGECTRTCIPDTDDHVYNDCGDGFGCHRLAYKIAGYGYIVNDYYCARGSAVDCTSDAQCRENDEICGGIWPVDDLDGVMPLCRTPEPCAAAFGEACNNSDNQCETGWCLLNYLDGSQTCTAICSQDADCPDGYQCRDYYLFNYGSDLPDVLHAMCMPANLGMALDDSHVPCYRDSMCEGDQKCIGMGLGIFPEEIGPFHRYCSSETAGGAALGESCDNDTVCASQLCLDGVCSRPCRELDSWGLGLSDGTCPDTMLCTQRKFSVAPGSNPGVDVCLEIEGSWTACAADADCGEGEFCGGLMLNTETDIYEAHCVTQRGTKLFGETCKPNSTDDNRSCTNGLCLKEQKICTVACSTTDDTCPEGYHCGEIFPFDGDAAALVCVPDEVVDGDEDLEPELEEEIEEEAVQEYEAEIEPESEMAEVTENAEAEEPEVEAEAAESVGE